MGDVGHPPLPGCPVFFQGLSQLIDMRCQASYFVPCFHGCPRLVLTPAQLADFFHQLPDRAADISGQQIGQRRSNHEGQCK